MSKPYLGPELLGIPWNPEKDVSKYIGKNLIIEDFSSEESVKSFLKTFILRTYIKYNFSYRLAAPYAVVDSYFASSSPGEGPGRLDRTDLRFQQLISTDLLVLRLLGSDPRHGQYSSILTTLIQERALRRRVTWIFSKYRIESSTFEDVYGAPFASFLEGGEPGFHRVKNSGTK